MKRTNSRLLAIILMLAMALCIFPASVGAQDIDVNERYGRSALEALPNSEALVFAYDAIVDAVEAHETESFSVYDGVHPISESELTNVFDAYRRDYAEHFWIGNGFLYICNSRTITSVMLDYVMDDIDTEAAKVIFNAKMDIISSGITSDMSDFDIELYIHDALAHRVVYGNGDNGHNAFGALVNGVAVCEGYAEAFQCLLQRAGVDSFLALGDSVNVNTGALRGHEWNYVKINGQWYHADLTWDDQADAVFHAYFNLSDSMIAKDHKLDDAAFSLPVCNSTDAFYFTVYGGELSSYDSQTVGALLKNNNMKTSVYVDDPAAFKSWYKSNISDIARAAGAKGGFSYGSKNLGGEVIIYFVLPKVDVTGVTTTKNSIRLFEGRKSKLSYIVNPLNATVTDVTFASTDPSIAMVAPNGVITALKEGTTVVTVTTDDGSFEAYFTVTVYGTPINSGDVDGDGKFNSKDVLLTMRFMTGWGADMSRGATVDSTAADFNNDGKVNNRDIVMMLLYMLNA